MQENKKDKVPKDKGKTKVEDKRNLSEMGVKRAEENMAQLEKETEDFWNDFKNSDST